MATTRLKITYRKTDTLIPWATNSKLHSQGQIAQIAASILEFGFTAPVLIADGQILAGHGRVQAAQLLGMEEVPTIDLSHLTPAQRRAYVIADNRLAETGGGWDMEMLRAEMDRLSEEGIDLTLTGFDSIELETGDLEDFGVDGDEQRGGGGSSYLAFGDRRVPISEDELAGLRALHDAHMEAVGSPNGPRARLRVRTGGLRAVPQA